jgi:hypothetical protein
MAVVPLLAFVAFVACPVMCLVSCLDCPEMQFLDIILTKDSNLLLHAVHSLFYWRILRKPNSSLVFKILTKKFRETRKLESIHE